MEIAILNKSAAVSDEQLTIIAEALTAQLRLHFEPAWGLSANLVSFYADPTKAPGYAWLLHVIDEDTQAEGALGYHTEDAGGRTDAFVMTSPILKNGGAVMVFDPANPGQYTVSGTISHEVMEMIGDRFTNTYCDCGDTSFCQEMCDSCEEVGYGYITNCGVNVALSDFTFPAYWNPKSTAANAPFNYLNTIKTPFAILPGGYSIERKNGPGSEQQVFGERMPQWRRECKQKAFARGGRRINSDK